MPARVTTIEREIALEERRVGIPTNQPLTDRAIARRCLQIAFVLGASGFVALFAVFFAGGVVRIGAIALAVAFGAYAMEKDRHLRRLASLRGDSMRITLAVANEHAHQLAVHRHVHVGMRCRAMGRGARE